MVNILLMVELVCNWLHNQLHAINQDNIKLVSDVKPAHKTEFLLEDNAHHAQPDKLFLLMVDAPHAKEVMSHLINNHVFHNHKKLDVVHAKEESQIIYVRLADHTPTSLLTAKTA